MRINEFAVEGVACLRVYQGLGQVPFRQLFFQQEVLRAGKDTVAFYHFVVFHAGDDDDGGMLVGVLRELI